MFQALISSCLSSLVELNFHTFPYLVYTSLLSVRLKKIV